MLHAAVEKDGKGLAPGTVKLSAVSKRFRKRTLMPKGYSSVKTSLLNIFKSQEEIDQNSFTALDTISVTVEPGSSLGIIGRNGSGKSTMLKLISGIYKPDKGSVDVSGKISALIELGAGFHPEFTGRENIHLGGVMYGLTKREIDERFDDIVSYAELEDYIDDPVKTYSSGMYMRLGFSLAIHTDPDILLVDEVLAVGDAGFIHRCQETISDFHRRGKTMIFVTHDLQAVSRWCDEVIWLHEGEVVKRGEPRFVVDSYLQAIEEIEEEALGEQNKQLDNTDNEPKASDGTDSDGHSAEAEDEHRWGNGDVEITSVRMFSKAGEERWLFHDEDDVSVEVEFEIKKPLEELVFGVGILRADGVCVHGTNTDIDDVAMPSSREKEYQPQKGKFRFAIDRLGLSADTYYLDVAAHRSDGTPYDYHHRLHKFSVRSQTPVHGIYNPKREWKVELAGVGES